MGSSVPTTLAILCRCQHLKDKAKYRAILLFCPVEHVVLSVKNWVVKCELGSMFIDSLEDPVCFKVNTDLSISACLTLLQLTAYVRIKLIGD